MEENKSHAEKYDFQHGYTSGLESVDKNNYEGYLSSQVNFEWLDKQLQEQKHKNKEQRTSTIINTKEQIQNKELYQE